MQSDGQWRADAGLEPHGAALVGAAACAVVAAVSAQAQGAAPSSAGVTPCINDLKVTV